MKRLLRPRLVLTVIAVILIAVGPIIVLARQQTAHAAVGDWPTFLFDNTRSGYNASETIINKNTAPNLKLHWSRAHSTTISTEPVVANGMLYWGSWDGLEHASRLINGADVWTANLGTSVGSCASTPHGVTSTATIAYEQIGGVNTPVDFVGGGANATFYALNANTGAVIWSTQLSSQPGAYIWSSPAVVGGYVYIGLSSLMDCPLVQGEVLQLNAVTGAIQSTFNTVPNGCVGASIWSSPTIDTSLNTIYVSTGNAGTCSTSETMAQALIALRAPGLTLVGSWQIPSSPLIDGDFGATPTLFSATIGGTLHQMVGLINKNGIYYAFDRTNISAGPLWQDQLGSPNGTGYNISSSAWDGTYLYVGAYKTTINGTTCLGSLQALDPATGAIIWQDCLSQPGALPVIAVPGLVVYEYGNTLMIADSSTGNTLFSYLTGPKFLGPPSISNGVMYAANGAGRMFAFGT